MPNETLPPELPVLPLEGALPTIDALLREPKRVIEQLRQRSTAFTASVLFASAVLCIAVYGVVMGSFSGGEQLWAAPLKLSLGMIFTGIITLPSLFIMACLGGSRAKLGETIALLGGLLGLFTMLLIGFAPVAWIFSRSIESVAAMGFLHLVFALVATLFAARFLRLGFKTIGIQSTIGINVWLMIFMLVGLQMTTTLRPLIGTSPNLITNEKKFFLTNWFETMDHEHKPAPKGSNAGPASDVSR